MKALGVRRQPAVDGRWAEVELRAEAVKRPARWRDPSRIWVTREQHGLLCVGAKAADDDERMTVAARRSLESVKRDGDVWTHRLALTRGQRPAVLAGPHRAEQQVVRRRQLRLGARARGHLLSIAHRYRVADVHAHAHRSEAVAIRKAHDDLARAVAPRRLLSGAPSELDVRVTLDVSRVGPAAELRRLEQAWIGVVHRPRRGERREVGGTLLVALGADPLRDRAEHEHAQ